MRVLLAIDVGNTNTVLGLFDGKRLKKSWRIISRPKAILAVLKKIPNPIDGIIISSVVPSLDKPLRRIVKSLSGKEPLFVHSRTKMPIRIRVKNPHEVGADRIVNAVAAYEKYKRALIIIDLGTATTFDVVTARGEYIGGTITPGIGIANEALAARCSKLPFVPLSQPKKAIGKTTVEAIRSGVYWGYVGLIDEMVRRLSRDLKSKPLVIATGGLATFMAKNSKAIQKVDGDLTLRGLQILADYWR